MKKTTILLLLTSISISAATAEIKPDEGSSLLLHSVNASPDIENQLNPDICTIAPQRHYTIPNHVCLAITGACTATSLMSAILYGWLSAK